MNNEKDAETGTYTPASDSESLDLVDRNEKEILEHPDQVTANALPGVQKAEAVALVWDKKALYATYAW